MKGLSLSVPVPTLTLYTDASNLGWGAYLEGSWALGLWFPLQQKEHINLLEMKAVHLALSHLRTTLHLKSLVLATDNTTVVAYLKNQGGTHCFSLYSFCREILLLCSELQIQLVVRHIPGHLNVLADTVSRSLAPVNKEWELLHVIFNAISLL
jgi:ribonuclease HI